MADSKNLAKMMPKTANNPEKARWESPLPEGNTLYSNVLQDSLHGIKCSEVIVEQVASYQQQQESAEHANNRKKARRESSLPERNTLYYNMVRNSAPSMIYSAMAEQTAVLRQKVAEHAIKMAADAKTSAKRMREAANDSEKATLDTLDTLSLPEGSVLYNMLQDSLSIVKGSADRAEQNAIHLQEIAERKIEIAAVAKISAKMMRETANKRKKAGLESPLLEGNTVYNNMHQDSLIDMKCSADFAEQVPIYQQELADVANAHESFVKMMCKTVDDQEKTRLESSLPGGNTLYNNMLRDSFPNMKRSADMAEQTAIRDQVTAELAIKAAADIKTLSKDDA